MVSTFCKNRIHLFEYNNIFFKWSSYFLNIRMLDFIIVNQTLGKIMYSTVFLSFVQR